jgi:hypothetical protein
MWFNVDSLLGSCPQIYGFASLLAYPSPNPENPKTHTGTKEFVLMRAEF